MIFKKTYHKFIVVVVPHRPHRQWRIVRGWCILYIVKWHMQWWMYRLCLAGSSIFNISVACLVGDTPFWALESWENKETHFFFIVAWRALFWLLSAEVVDDHMVQQVAFEEKTPHLALASERKWWHDVISDQLIVYYLKSIVSKNKMEERKRYLLGGWKCRVVVKKGLVVVKMSGGGASKRLLFILITLSW